jgi:catechol 2,3-dioxygenase-like lactoylglutathione lyase family enzyme
MRQAMRFEVQQINHVGIVVRDRVAAERFYVDILGFEPLTERPWWLRVNDRSTIHLIHLEKAEADDSLRRRYQHFALQVEDLRAVLEVLLEGGVRVFQVDFQGNEQVLTATEEAIDFGVGSLFVHDPDGNLVEFMQLGHGIFATAE